MDNQPEKITNCFLPQLVDQIFDNLQRKVAITTPTKETRSQFFYDLSVLLGEELVRRTLQLLDVYRFTYYYAKHRQNQCVVELYKGTEYFRLLPKINYCKCDFFQSYVLQLPTGRLYPDIPTSQEFELAGWNEVSRQSYTCQHVLGLRLQQLLKLSDQKVNEKILYPAEFREIYLSIFED